MSLNNRSILFLKGMAMGISDLIPGISGGTIALLLGIYKDFISSLKSINYKSFIYLVRLDFKKLNNQLNLCFLLPVFFGILSSIFIFSSLISFLLLDYKVLLFSFFFGLIFFSSIRLISSLKPTSTLDFFTVFVGLVIGLSFFFVSSLSTSNSIFSIFLAGFIAISAMLLPGISGSYILLILGKYEFMLDSISSFNWINILIFSLGAIAGILSFSKMIHYLLKNYYRSTIFFLSGLMMGALNKVWPWQLDNKIVLPEGDILMPFIIFILSGIISYNLKSE
jgi:putative membrane protein|tara:strand:- start:3368 stop:4207 length:840 start_codon:yes stop_codon:yes gene_type:complete